MNITQQTLDNKVILKLSGRFNFQARKTFTGGMVQAQATNCYQIIVNLAEVPYVDSAAVGLLMLTHKQLNLANRQLILEAPQKYVSQVLELMNIHKSIPIVATDEKLERNLACG